MSATNPPDNLIIREFTSSKQTKVFQSLQDAGLTGYLTFINPLQQNQWYFALYQGQVLYATGGKHPLRRWQRNMTSFLPSVNFDPSYMYQKFAQISATSNSSDDETVEISPTFWEYKLLHTWVENKEIRDEQAQILIYSTVTEILFDITQGMEVICRAEVDDSLFTLLDGISLASVISESQKQWQEWQNAMVADRSPNLAPVILQPNQLKQKTEPQVYQEWYELLNGELTLRDIAVEKKIPPLKVIQFFLPHIQSGIIGLVEVGDIGQPHNSDTVLIVEENKQQPLIACIDDSRVITSMIEQILAVGGYRFVAINDPLEAVSRLKECRPDLILLDIFMPEIDGYELCSQLRQNPYFADTPIIFLTSSDSVIDRIKSKIAGSSYFLQKTVDADKLLNTIAKHLPSGA
ncbi:MAG: response regulator [Xenococcaceae cyanobacterium MO_207.B15]|nr:response regulator [Xenococcaceae cyanobacterium MO_207.B15]